MDLVENPCKQESARFTDVRYWTSDYSCCSRTHIHLTVTQLTRQLMVPGARETHSPTRHVTFRVGNVLNAKGNDQSATDILQVYQRSFPDVFHQTPYSRCERHDISNIFLKQNY